MRRFELIEGKSAKFWETAVEGASVTVRYGRLAWLETPVERADEVVVVC